MPDLAVLHRLDSVESRVRDIQVAIPPIVQALTVIGSEVHSIEGEVQVIRAHQHEARQLLDSLREEFRGYVDDYRRRTELQLAETRIVKVRQEIEQRFGHFSDVRRRVTGILQATDLSIVRQETVRTVSEELMLGAPRYWLAPTLVALMSWIVDEREIADRALTEAIRRDCYKTGLFLTLVCRRAARWEAMNRWLALYLQLLDPMAIDREIVVVLDAVATGTLGRQAQELFWQVSLGWIEELRRMPGMMEEQARRWLEVLDAERGVTGPEEITLLRKYSPTSPLLASSLANARRNRRVLERFRQVLQNRTDLPASVATVIDDLLDSLVTRFDDEELPLRKQERLLQLIIDEEGNRARAEEKMAVEEQAIAEKVSFVARLTNAVMFPEQSGATHATQRFAAAFSREWILAAHLSLVRRDQDQIPVQVELRIRDWQGISQDGGNGRELAESVQQLYEAKKQGALAEIKLPAYAWMAPIAGLLFLVLWMAGMVTAVFGLAFAAIGALLFFLGKRSQLKKKEARAAEIDREAEEVQLTLEACLAELVGYRGRWAAAHAEASEVEALLRAITIADSVYSGAGEPAGLLSSGGQQIGLARQSGSGAFQGSRLAEQLAAWDLTPPPAAISGTDSPAAQ